VQQIASESLTKLFEHISGSDQLVEDYNVKEEDKKKAEDDLLKTIERKKMINQQCKQAGLQKKEADEYALKVAKLAELKQHRVLYSLLQIEEEIEAHHDDIKTIREELDEFEAEQQDLDSRLKEAKRCQGKESAAHRKVVKQLEQLKDRQDKQNPQLIKRRETLRVCQKRIKDDKALLSKARGELNKQASDCETLEADVSKLEQTLSDLDDSSQEGVRFEAEQIEQYQRIKEQARIKTVKKRAEVDALKRQLQADQTQLEQLQTSTDERVEAKQGRESELTEQQARGQTLAEHIDATRAKLAEAKSQCDVVQKTADVSAKQRAAVDNELVEVGNALRSAKDDRRQNEKDIKQAECLADLQKTFPGVRGRLVDLCKPTQRKYDLATSVAVGKHMDAIVVNTEATGFECIQHMRDQRKGVASFIPLDTIRPKPIGERLRNLGPKYKLLVDVLECDDAVRPALQFAVGNAVLCENLDDARKLCFDRNERVKAVTLQGAVISKAGSMTGGSTSRDADRARRWDDSNNERQLVELKEHKARLTQQQAGLARAARANDARKLEDLQAQVKQHTATLSYAQADLKVTNQKIKAAEAQIRTLDDQLKKQRPAMQKLGAGTGRIESQMQKLTSAINKEQDKLFAKFSAEVGVDNIREYEEEISEKEEKNAEQRQQLTKHLNKIKNQLEFTQQRDFKSDVNQARKRITTEEKKLAKLQDEETKEQEARKSSKVQLEELEEGLEAAAAVLKERDAEIISINKDRKETKSKLDSCRGKESEIDTGLERLRTRRHDQMEKATREHIELPRLTEDTRHSDDEHDSQRSGRDSSDGSSRRSSASGGFSQSTSATVMRDAREVDKIDFSVIREKYKTPRDAKEFNARDTKFRDQIEQREKEREMMQPNMKAAERCTELEKVLEERDREFKEARSNSQRRQAAFDQVKADRVELFKKAVSHVEKKLDPIYKNLTKSKKHAIGGKAQLVWEEDAEEPYLAPHEVKLWSMPQGKRFRSMDQLSGGEQTVAALALLFAFHSYQKTPFFVLDEVDAALDNVNVDKVASYIQKQSSDCQMIVISLKDEFYKRAHSLIGVYKDKASQSSGTLTLPLEQYESAA
jgi:structural maintenance of chromosome 1